MKAELTGLDSVKVRLYDDLRSYLGDRKGSSVCVHYALCLHVCRLSFCYLYGVSVVYVCICVFVFISTVCVWVMSVCVCVCV